MRHCQELEGRLTNGLTIMTLNQLAIPSKSGPVWDILGTFWGHFGDILGTFWDILRLRIPVASWGLGSQMHVEDSGVLQSSVYTGLFARGSEIQTLIRNNMSGTCLIISSVKQVLESTKLGCQRHPGAAQTAKSASRICWFNSSPFVQLHFWV